jgi:hypothetical protein
MIENINVECDKCGLKQVIIDFKIIIHSILDSHSYSIFKWECNHCHKINEDVL